MLDRSRLIELLRSHHLLIGGVIAEAERALDCPELGHAATLGTLRWRLVRLLRAYQLFKHSEIFDPMADGRDPAKVQSASAMKARCIAAGAAYNRHVVTWSLDGIDNWSAYRQEKVAIIAAIRAHLKREDIEVQALLAI